MENQVNEAQEKVMDVLLRRIEEKNNPTIIGLDTDFEFLPVDLRRKVFTLKEAAARVFEFNRNIIDSIHDIVPAIKIQIAYYEKLGVPGMQAFHDTLTYARERGLSIISDVKRNDIGSSMAAYSAAHIGRTRINNLHLEAFPADFITVNAYFGSESLFPVLEDCQMYGKGIFLLVKTSNPGGAEFQDLNLSWGYKLFEHMAESVKIWGQRLMGDSGYSSVGAVVGATNPEEAENLRQRMPTTMLLVPGFGAQGGSAENVVPAFNQDGRGAIVNNSRGILLAHRKPECKDMTYYEAARMKCIEMRDQINEALVKAGKKK